MNAIEFKQVTKKLAHCIANRNLSFEVKKGTVHGLVGENGAGKSTAMKCLFGIHSIDEGEILINGRSVRLGSPVQAMKHGVGMVHQHFMLAPNESILDNLILGQEPGFGFISHEKAIKKLDQICKQYGFVFKDWNAPVSTLSVGEQQRVEILKLLYQESEILILDEPTAVLTPQETTELFQNLKRLKEEGRTIVLISHKLKEILEFTDYVTVMRRGESVVTMATREATEDLLAQNMVGRSVSFTYQGERKMFANAKQMRPLLRVDALSIESTSEPLKNVSFAVHPGEIVGVAGIQGNGQSELLRFLSSPKKFHKKMTGTYEMNGREISDHSPQDLRREGVGLIPEDRLSEGLLLHQDMTRNFLLGQHWDSRYQSNGFLNFKKAKAAVTEKVKEYDIRPTEPETVLGRMSGGNQQKLVVARALDADPKVLFAAHLTRGVDVGAIEKIHEEIVHERNKGKGILLFSSELDELFDLCDRLLVFYNGEIRAEFDCREFDFWTVGKVMGGGSK